MLSILFRLYLRIGYWRWKRKLLRQLTERYNQGYIERKEYRQLGTYIEES